MQRVFVRSPVVLSLVVLAMLSVAWPSFAAEPKSPAAAPQVEQVIVVFKTHFDIGYTQLAREVVERYRTSMIDKALAVCDASRSLPPENRFVWTLSGWPMTQILWPGQTPERRTRIEKAIREGRLVWHALAGTTHTESLGLEDLVRSLGFSSRLARQFGQPLPRDAKMTDVPCHTWVVPTVLRRAGVEFLHLGCNSASGSPEVPVLFWWEGPDGSRLLTMYTAEGYGTGLKPPKGWQHKTWLALIHTGDNHGPPEPGEVQTLLERAKRELPGVKIRMGRLSDFGDAILAEEKQSPKLPVVRKDMPDSWIHGIMSMPREAATAREVRPQMGALESLNTLLRCWGVNVPPVKDKLASAYEGSFLYSEHTWGASSRYYSPRLYGETWKEAQAAGKYAYAEESWKEHREYIGKAIDLTEPVLGDNALALAKAVNVPGPRITVYNPLPWARSVTCCMHAAASIEGPPPFVRELPKKYTVRWRDVATGKTAATGMSDGLFLLTASDVPAMGYRVYVPVDPPKPDAAPKSKTPKLVTGAKPTSAMFESPFFRVEFDTLRGGIKSLVVKRTGHDLVDGKGVGVCPLDSPLVSLGRPGAFRYTKEWTSRKPTVFVNVFNNIWGTNFQQWVGDSLLTCNVRIWSVESRGNEADLITPSWEARTECQAAFFDGPPGKLPPVQSGLELSRKGVLVTAFGPNPDGDGTLLRLWEQAGQDGMCRVRLPEALRSAKARLCDLRGLAIKQPVTIKDGWLEVPLTHFAPASVILER